MLMETPDQATNQPPDDNPTLPDIKGNIGPWILKSFNDLNNRFDDTNKRLDSIDKNLKWLNRLAWFMIACIGIFLFICLMFIRPAIPFVLNKLFPGVTAE